MAGHPDQLRIFEIFYSLQGESRTVGLPTVFVRLSGCPLRCSYCDTEYAFSGGDWMGLGEIFEKIAGFDAKYVTVTGGEPLAQRYCNDLLVKLCDAGYQVSLETSGAVSIAEVDPRVVKVMDLKTPASGEVEKNLYENLDYLDEKDQLKFVICNQHDYDWSCAMLEKYNLAARCEVLFSASHQAMEERKLADWILRDHLPVRMQIQLHKYLWGDEQGR
ncbi:MAG: 7-carboxy-7-deazaguanine synthase QueE [Gammaproteobacteria bacterium]|nr:7-carboxy-7-deazaguanine synthase QueE [Gammaproteobacteria bacterium]MCW8922866.1 7-carboxy-7-deazaguanine synthase QueE [Gammaproteobacteria bacterium]